MQDGDQLKINYLTIDFKKENKSLKLEELIYLTDFLSNLLSFQSGRPTNPEQAIEELTNFKIQRKF